MTNIELEILIFETYQLTYRNDKDLKHECFRLILESRELDESLSK